VRIKLAVNVAKSKVMRVARRENADNRNITVNGVRMEEVECFRYVGVDIDRWWNEKRDETQIE
jgi:hypothetical protein